MPLGEDSLEEIRAPGPSILCLSVSGLKGALPAKIGKLAEVKELYLNFNELSGAIPPEIGSLTNLHILEAKCNQLSGTLPPEIGSLYNLSSLILCHNEFSGSIPPEISALTGLQELQVRYNQLSGAIPSQIRGLVNLKKLYLNSNRLTGSIPPEVSELRHLVDLNLSDNQLSGSIPLHLSKLTKLRLLALSNNHLTGIIPVQLSELKNLESLSLSYNLLTGEVPEELMFCAANISIEGTLIFQQSVHLPPKIGKLYPLRSAWAIGIRHPLLFSILSSDPEAVEMAKWIFDRRTSLELQDLQIVFKLRPNSPWQFWIPLCYWLMGTTWPDALYRCWSEVPPSVTIPLTRFAIPLLVDSIHGNALHLLAYFDLDENHLGGVGIPALWTKQKDRHHRTPIQIVQSQYSVKESRCSSFLAQKELELMMDQKAVHERLQLQRNEEDILLQQELQLLTRAQPPSINGALYRTQRVLEKYLATTSHILHVAQVKDCIQWLRLVSDLHWLGHKTRDLEAAKQFLARSRKGGNLSIRKLSPLRLLEKTSERAALLRPFCEELEIRLSQDSVKSVMNDQYSIPAYQQVLQWCRQHPKTPAQGTWLHDIKLGSLLLTAEATQHLLPNRALKSQVEGGHHVILTHGGMHFKVLRDSHDDQVTLRPAMPGAEFMVDRLTKLTIGHGTPPCRLIKLMRGDRQVVMQVTRSVDGTTLDWVLDRHPQLVNRVDHANMSDITLMSLLVNRLDGKPENYMVEMEYSPGEGTHREVKSLHLVSIDNDLVFGEPIVPIPSPEGNEFTTEVRNVVYLLPGMDKAIDPSSRDRFLQCEPDLICIKWLSMIVTRNRKHENMKSNGVFTREEFEGDFRRPQEPGLQLPIRVPRFATSRVYNTIVKLQDKLRTQPDSTLHELFAHVQPELAETYLSLRHSDGTIRQKVLDLYYHSMAWLSRQDLEKLALSSSHPMYSKIIYHAYHSNSRSRALPLSMEDAVAELLLAIDVERMEILLQSQVLNQVPLPNPTTLMHLLIRAKKLSCSFLSFLRKKGANLQRVSEVGGPPYLPVQLAVQSPTPWTVDLVRDLVDAGSPIDHAGHPGRTEELMYRCINDKDTREQLIAIFQRHNSRLATLQNEFEFL